MINVIKHREGRSRKFNPFRSFVLTALFLTSVSWSADFRENDWGDSPENVISLEGEGSVGETRPPGWGHRTYVEILNYAKPYFDIRAVIYFRFTEEEKLGCTGCIARKNGLRPFWVWEEKLTALYGEPENRDDVLTDDESILDVYYRGDATAVEEGLLKGYFALVRYWEAGKTYIWLVAELYDDKLEVHMSYHSKEYFDFFRKEKARGGPRRGFRPWFDD